MTKDEIIAYAEERYKIVKGMCRIERRQLEMLKKRYIEKALKELNLTIKEGNG